jgi:predicted phosphodiesterase
VKLERVKSALWSSKAGNAAGYLLALVFALVFVGILGQQSFKIEALEVRLSVHPSTRGQTVVEIPPLASITAKTHSTPLSLDISLQSIDLQLVQYMLDKKEINAGVVDSVAGDLRRAAVYLAVKIILLSAAGGAFGIFLLQRRPGLRHLQGAAAAALVVGVLLLGTYTTYDINRFKNPEYTGALKTAPWIIGLAGEALDKMDTLNNKMELVAANVHQLFNQIDNMQVYESREGLVKVLHVSDIHNNPAAMTYIQSIADSFQVDAIIDTGDITDYGTPLESLLLERLSGLKRPYLYVPGNHDSPETVKKMKSIRGVTVLDRSTARIKNLLVAGFADPSSKTQDITPPPLDMIPGHAGEIEEFLLEQPQQPDILALHNNRIAALLPGKAPVIIYGHDHRLAIKKEADSVLIDAGSAGAAGLRVLQGEKTPYSLDIQYYAPVAGKMKLEAVDTITIENLDSGFHLERHVF